MTTRVAVAVAVATPPPSTTTRRPRRRGSPPRARGGRDASSSATMDAIDEDVVVSRLAPSARTGERRAEWRAMPSGREAVTSRIARAVAGADAGAGAVVGGAACAWLALRARGAATRAATWERRARNAEAANQELEWRLRVATANGGQTTGSRTPAPDPVKTRRETSTPRTRATSSASTVDVRDVVIEGLKLETEALKSALAAARAETRAVMASNFADDDDDDDDDR